MKYKEIINKLKSLVKLTVIPDRNAVGTNDESRPAFTFEGFNTDVKLTFSTSQIIRILFDSHSNYQQGQIKKNILLEEIENIERERYKKFDIGLTSIISNLVTLKTGDEVEKETARQGLEESIRNINENRFKSLTGVKDLILLALPSPSQNVGVSNARQQ